jgi:hypothetical protein
LVLSHFIHGVPVAVITYGTDVAPHLQRALAYRRLRIQRWQALHRHDSKIYDAVDSSRWAETGQFFNLLIEVIAVAFFVAGCLVFEGLKLGRLRAMLRH